MKRIVRIAGAVMGALCFMVSGLLTPVSAAEKVVNIAYQTTYSPWIAAMVNGAFERATGYRIHWKKFDSGAAVMSAMASGSVDIGVLGSSPLAAAASRGMDIQLFWILEDIANAEALMVRNAANIASPQDLKGKTIAVPVASTSHYQLMYMLDKWGLTQQVKLVNMTPAQAAAAWERGDVDGAFIWGPALGRIRPTGKPLITAGQICELGRCTFEGMAVTKPFGAANPDFMAKFIEVLNSTNRDFAAHPEAWAVGSSNLAAVIKGLGGKPEDAAEEMALYKYPALADQVSCQWLGCGAKGGAAKTLMSTAEFLLQQKKIDTVKSDYSSAVAVRYPEATLGLTRK